MTIRTRRQFRNPRPGRRAHGLNEDLAPPHRRRRPVTRNGPRVIRLDPDDVDRLMIRIPTVG